MQNDTGGLLGGILIVGALVAGAVWISPGARAWVAAKIAGTGAASAAVPPDPGSGVAAPNSGSFGTFNALPAAASQPYQLTFNPQTGVGISTAAEIPVNEAPMIALPSVAPLAPTSPSLVYA